MFAVGSGVRVLVLVVVVSGFVGAKTAASLHGMSHGRHGASMQAAEKCLVTSASAVGCSSKIRASPRSAHHCRAKPPLMGLQRPTSTDRKAMLEDMMAPCSNTAQCHFAGDDLTNLACLFSLRSAIKGAIPFSITGWTVSCTRLHLEYIEGKGCPVRRHVLGTGQQPAESAKL